MKRKYKKITIKKVIINIFILIILLSFVITYVVKKDNNEKALNVVSNNKIIEDVNIDVGKIKEYKVDLNKFNISNNGENPVETSKGINDMLVEAKNEGYNKIVMPKGEYSISEENPIVMISDMILDLNGSTFKINPNGLQHYVVINFTKCKNSILTNGIIKGDKEEHDYTTISGSHEWTTGVVFNDSESCQLENITVKDFPGYGISSSLGENLSNLQVGVTNKNLIIGNISNNGKLNNKEKTIRTIEPLDISGVGEEFELGYNKGYMGYPYMQSKEFNSYFYDNDMNYISMEKCKQYKKVPIPQNAKYVHFVFFQEKVPDRGDTDFEGTTLFLTNYDSPYKIKIRNCTIEGNKALGMGLCGGRNFIIENNTFKENGGGAPGYAIDLEDGWEYMDGYLFKDNKFIGNSNDVVVCAGDNIIFESNEFSSTVYMWGRATNYNFINNTFENIKMNINYEYSTNTICKGNTYINCRIAIGSKNKNANIDINNEELINTSVNTMPEEIKIVNSTIDGDEDSQLRLAGQYENCRISVLRGDFISSRITECNIYKTNINIQGNLLINKCNINNSSFVFADEGKSEFNNNDIVNSDFSIATWGKACELSFLNNNISIDEKSLINMSAGKTRNLIFKENYVVSTSEKAIFNLYDTSYSTPNGNATISDNKFNVAYKYIFDGAKINSGKFSLSYSNNSYENTEFINTIYLQNDHFKITE